MTTSYPYSGIESYHIGIVCALDSELAAVEAILDEEHDISFVRDKSDNNCYTFGKIHKHNVVVACLPAGTDGLAAAATVAKDLIRTFPQLRFGLLVGIGGGVPDLEKNVDIRLGDVVVGQPMGSHGGVIQYDKGKRVVGEKGWERKGVLNAPPAVLMTSVQKLKAKHRRTPSLVATYVAEMLERYPGMADHYSHPGAEKDVLYNASTDHVNGAATCQNCPVAGQVKRPERASTAPKIHYGLIASGNSVVKDPRIRDFLRDTDGALCVEMEAAGLMNEFPCLVIRGICDYADSHKNDKWHEYAAAVAASYAKELLLYVSPADTTQSFPLQSVMNQLTEQHRDVQNNLVQLNKYAELQLSYQQSDNQHKCHRTFKKSDYEMDMRRNRLREPGTCEWVLQHEQFVSWLQSDLGEVLWISADPGCGKSVLSRSLAEQDIKVNSKHSDLTVCYYFFKDIKGQDSLSTALCAVLHQLFTQQPWLITEAVVETWQAIGDKIQNEPHILWNVLLRAASDGAMRPVYCILDALDECAADDRTILIHRLQEFHSDSKRNKSGATFLKFLVTSRPYFDIEYWFEHTAKSSSVIRLRGEEANDQIRQEIDIVVRCEIQRMAKGLRLSQATSDDLQQRLLSMEHRTYLWLYLALGSIRAQFKESLVPDTEKIKNLPDSVEAAYEQILSKVKDRERVRRILTIIVGAMRALTIDEMAIALELDKDASRIHSFEDFLIEPEHIRYNIRDWCGLFIYVQQDKLYLIHQTAKEFLLRDPSHSSPASIWRHSLQPFDVEVVMVRIYLKFLCLNQLQEKWEELDKILNGPRDRACDEFFKRRMNSFFLLAAQSWMYHWAKIEADIDVDSIAEIRILYDGRYRCRERWSRAMALSRPRFHQVPSSEIHLAAWNDDAKMVEALLSEDPKAVDLLDDAKRDPMAIAAFHGSFKALRKLVEYGASIEGVGPYNVLAQAIKSGHEAIVRYLVDHGAHVNRRTVYKRCAPANASSYGRTTIIGKILELGDELRFREDSDESALIKAVRGGYAAIVRLLLEHGAEIDATYHERTALIYACEDGNEVIVQLLLEHGAKVNLDKIYWSTLLRPCREGHQELVRILLEHGADPNAVHNNTTALIQACIGEHIGIVQLLLKNGANPDVPTLIETTALREASINGNEMIVRLLLENGADPNGGRSGDGRSALSEAINRRSVSITRLLLENGADPKVTDFCNNPVLTVASGEGDTEIVRLLLEHGADPDVQDQTFGAAIHYATYQEDKEGFKLLLDYGADINAQNVQCLSPLYIAAGHCSEDMVKFILEQGAEVKSISHRIYWVCLSHDTCHLYRILKHMLDAGVVAADMTQSLHHHTRLELLCYEELRRGLEGPGEEYVIPAAAEQGQGLEYDEGGAKWWAEKRRRIADLIIAHARNKGATEKSVEDSVMEDG